MNSASFQEKSRQEVLQALARDPASVAEYALQLQAQLAATRQELTQKEQLLATTHQALAQQEQLLAEARAYIAQLKRQLFGPKADKLNPEQEEQLRQLTGDLQEQAQRPPPVSRTVLEAALPPRDPQKAKRTPRRPSAVPVQLEVQTVTLEPEDRACGLCQREGQRIGQEITTEYDYLPARLICKQTIRPKYARVCACTGPGVTIAPLPPRLVPQSKLGLGLAVHLLLSRFDDHVAYYTLERIFRERHGVILPRSQMVQWVEKIAFLLLAVYHGIWEELQATGYLQVDETPVKVLDPEVKGKAATGYLWFYAHPQADVFLEFCDSRGREDPRQRLQQFKGTIQTDAYGVYDSLRRERPGTLRRLGCLSHARRRFYTAAEESCIQAIWFIAQIRQLYLIEDEVREGSDAERKTMRRAKAPPFWRAMKQRALQLQAQPGFLPKSSLGKAVNYFLKEYTALVGYLRDGRFEIDNNLVENEVRPSVVGRKRWLFIGHPDAGWRSAVLYTIIQSCRRRGINPQEYLADVLRRLPAMKNHEVKNLLPSRWKPVPVQPP
jgi:transposase